jgi:hypothetical protein
VLAAVAALAVQMSPLSIEQLAAHAKVVLHGQVRSKSCQRDEQGRICTRVELTVTEAWKGTVPGDRFLIVLAGGVLGEQRVVLEGQPDYQPGEEVVVFLSLNPQGEGVTVGLAQGKFDVWRDTDSGQKLARNPFHGWAPVGARTHARGQVSTGLVSVEELKRRVQATLR